MNAGLLFVTSVAAEADALLRHLPAAQPVDIPPYRARRTETPAGPVTVLAGGVGAAAAGAATGIALTRDAYQAVISAGVAGGFTGRAAIGDVVVADAEFAVDLAVETPEGLQPLGELGLQSTWIQSAASPVAVLAERIALTGLPVRCGTVLSVSTVTGTAERAAALAARYDPVAEAMEGHAVWLIARNFGIPAFEIRTICNPVGPRDRAGWRLDLALDALAAAGAAICTEPLP